MFVKIVPNILEKLVQLAQQNLEYFNVTQVPWQN